MEKSEGLTMNVLDRFAEMFLDPSELIKAREEARALLMSDLFAVTTNEEPTDDELFLAASLILQHVEWRAHNDDLNLMDTLVDSLAYWVFEHTDNPILIKWLRKEFVFTSTKMVGENDNKVISLKKIDIRFR